MSENVPAPEAASETVASPTTAVKTSSPLGVARKRAFGVAGLLLAMGTLLAFAPKPSDTQRSEQWVAETVPAEFDGYRMMPSSGGDVPAYCTYKVDAASYNVLKPWGIVGRIFEKGNESYDVLVVGSNTKDSFHDPSVCLGAQKWNLSNSREEILDTKTRGRVPVTMVDMQSGEERTTALYFYRLRDGYVASNAKAKMEMLVYPFSSKHVGANNEGGFIRIIPSRVGVVDAEKIKAFAAKWVDAASVTSKGYY